MPTGLGQGLRGHFRAGPAALSTDPGPNLGQLQAQAQAERERIQREWERLFQEAFEMSEDRLRGYLTSKNLPERFVAAYVVGERRLPWYENLIPLLKDGNDAVRQAARRSLVILSFLEQNPQERAPAGKGAPTPEAQLLPAKDFGPKPKATIAQREEAVRDWTAWWKGQRTRTLTPGALLLKGEVRRLVADLVNAPPAKRQALLEDYCDAETTDYTEALAVAAMRLEAEDRKAVRETLANRLSRVKPEALARYLKDDNAEIRRAAALAVALKERTPAALVPQMIGLLLDPEPAVVRAAHAALRALSKDKDFGPEIGAGDEDRREAVAQWTQWWSNGRRR